MMVEFSLLAARRMEPHPDEPFHRWCFSDGTEWTAFHRTKDGFLLRFPQLADYEVSSDGRIVTCTPAPNVARSTAEHLYLNQVLPLALSRFGKQVFHASAVDVGACAVAFLAASGRGKSTLAASFAVNEFRFLTDDGLILEESGAGFEVVPSHPSIRLWDDSHEFLLEPGAQKAPTLEFTSKARFMAGDHLTHCDQARPLRAAYFLGEGRTQDVTFDRLAPAAAVIEWTKHSFLLDIEDRGLISSHFDKIATLANAVPCFHLDYPRRYDRLVEVRNTIIAHATELGSRS